MIFKFNLLAQKIQILEDNLKCTAARLRKFSQGRDYLEGRKFFIRGGQTVASGGYIFQKR